MLGRREFRGTFTDRHLPKMLLAGCGLVIVGLVAILVLAQTSAVDGEKGAAHWASALGMTGRVTCSAGLPADCTFASEDGGKVYALECTVDSCRIAKPKQDAPIVITQPIVVH